MDVVLWVIGILVSIVLVAVGYYVRSTERTCAALKHDIEVMQRKLEMDEERHTRWRHDVWHPNNSDVQRRLATAEEKLRQIEKRMNGHHP